MVMVILIAFLELHAHLFVQIQPVPFIAQTAPVLPPLVTV
jgi:hypothetical protein